MALSISPYLLSDKEIEISPMGGGDLANLAKIENIHEDNPIPIFKKGCIPINESSSVKIRETYTMVCQTQKLNTLIFRDSFFVALEPYISRYFYRSTYIWKKIDYKSLTKYVEQENPDIVIDEVAERSFPYIPSL